MPRTFQGNKAFRPSAYSGSTHSGGVARPNFSFWDAPLIKAGTTAWSYTPTAQLYSYLTSGEEAATSQDSAAIQELADSTRAQAQKMTEEAKLVASVTAPQGYPQSYPQSYPPGAPPSGALGGGTTTPVPWGLIAGTGAVIVLIGGAAWYFGSKR